MPARGGALADAVADGDRAGERDRRHARVVDQRLADLAAATDHHVQNAFGKLSLLEGPGKMEPGERGVLGQLHHDRVAVGQRGGELPGRDRRGEVPRRDQPDHTERPAAGVDGGAGRGLLEHLPDRAPSLAGEEAEDLCRAACLQARLAQGLAHLAGHVLGDVLDPGLDRLGRARQDRAAFGRG